MRCERRIFLEGMIFRLVGTSFSHSHSTSTKGSILYSALAQLSDLTQPAFRFVRIEAFESGRL